jgi:hypothetical protein
MRFRLSRFGALAINDVTYDYNAIIDRGHVRKRRKAPSKPFRSSYWAHAIVGVRGHPVNVPTAGYRHRRLRVVAAHARGRT